MKCRLFAILAAGIFVAALPLVSSGETITLNQGWAIQAADRLDATGAAISQSDFRPVNWQPATVPSTVLGALVNDGVYPDPLRGKNLEAIPARPFQGAWWYRHEFTLAGPASKTYSRLLFDGINYRADVWLNGQKIAGSLRGAFRTFDLDVTAQLRPGVNVLAVEIFPPQPGDLTLGFVDWSPAPADHDMGLFREVHLRQSGAVSVEHPFVQSRVNLQTLQEADLIVTAEMANHTDAELSGEATVDTDGIHLVVPYTLHPRETRRLELTPEKYPALHIDHPRLWWPAGLGQPNLYSMRIAATAAGQSSDVCTVTFGIRQVGDYLNAQGYRGYMVNGKKLLIRGGGWVDDIFLRENEANLKAQLEYVVAMHLNAIRLEGFWGSSQKLYDLADRMGILVMVGWSCQWEWPEYRGVPIVESDHFGGAKTADEVALVTACWRDQVRWLRQHPSVLVWVLGSDKLPWPEVEKQYLADLKRLDPSRPTLSSCQLQQSDLTGSTAVKMAGPYQYVTPNYWWIDTKNGGAFGFNTETGPGPQIPPISTLRRMLSADRLWPINDEWNFHCGRFTFGNLDAYLKAHNARYGESATVEDFAFKAQATNYEAMRAMFEAFGANQPKTTGIIQWMLNASWPKFYWQLYDYYLMPNGALYGAMKGSTPLHVSYDYGNHSLYAANETLADLTGAKLRIKLFNLDSKPVFEQTSPIDCPAGTGRKLLTLPALDPASPVYFLDLRLTDHDGKELDRNFYWLSIRPDVLDEAKTEWYVTPNTSFADFKPLAHLAKAALKVAGRFGKGEVELDLFNPTDHVAFFNELQLLKDKSRQPVLPIFWDDNYVSLLPGEHRTLKVHYADANLDHERPVVAIQGWNTPPQELAAP